jgi:hypothetical protein
VCCTQEGKFLIVRAFLSVVLEIPPDENGFLPSLQAILDSGKDFLENLCPDGNVDAIAESMSGFAKNILTGFFLPSMFSPQDVFWLHITDIYLVN